MTSAQLLQAKDYREFIQIWINSKKNSKINFSALTRKAGFSSRSFIKEVLEGKRNLTNKSFPKFVRAFDLKGREAKFFECLVALESPGVDFGYKNKEQILAEMKRIKEIWNRKLRSANEPQSANTNVRWAFKIRYMGDIYAALGDFETGASIDEIKSRTGLPENLCLEVIDYLIQNQAILKKNERYYAQTINLDIFDLGNDESFKILYQEALMQLQRKAKTSLKSDREFFFHSAFSVRQSKLPEFKLRLKELALEFIDEAQEDNGDKVAKLTLGLHL